MDGLPKTTKELPEGYFQVEDIISLKEFINPKLKKGLYNNDNLKAVPQWVYIYSPNTGEYKPKYYWSNIKDHRIIILIKRGLLYANR